MKTYVGITCLFIALLSAAAYGLPSATPSATTAALQACTPVAGAAEEITATTGASDASAALTQLKVYYMKCDTEAYVRWGSTAPTAAAGDFKLPADTVLPFATTVATRYVAAKSVSVSGSCWIIACQ